MLNINGDINDANYRYKMPMMIIKVEGNGSNTRTIIVNFKEICNSIGREPNYVLNFFGKKLGTATTFKNDNYGLKGKISKEDLVKFLYEFINLYVMCKSCNNPETDFDYTKRKIVRCNACGSNSHLKERNKKLNEKTFTDIDEGLLFKNDKNEVNKIITFTKGKSPEEVIMYLTNNKVDSRNFIRYVLPKLISPNLLLNIPKFTTVIKMVLEKNQQLFFDVLLFLIIKEYEEIKINNKINGLFQYIYENDIVDEETIVSWYNSDNYRFISKENNNKIKEQVFDFINIITENSEENEIKEEEEKKEIEKEEKKEEKLLFTDLDDEIDNL